MLTLKVCRDKAFAAKQKIREFKKLLFKIKTKEKRVKRRIRPNKLTQKATNNLNKVKSVKYGCALEQIELKSINSTEFKEEYDFHSLRKVKLDPDRRERSDIKTDIRFKRTLRDLLDIGELVYVLAEELKKKDALRRLYRITTENTPLVNKINRSL